MTQLTEEETVRRGLIAGHILDSADIMLFLQEQLDDYKTTAFDLTDLDAAKEREKLFYQYQGVKDFLERLSVYRTAANSILDAMDNKE